MTADHDTDLDTTEPAEAAELNTDTGAGQDDHQRAADGLHADLAKARRQRDHARDRATEALEAIAERDQRIHALQAGMVLSYAQAHGLKPEAVQAAGFPDLDSLFHDDGRLNEKAVRAHLKDIVKRFGLADPHSIGGYKPLPGGNRDRTLGGTATWKQAVSR